MDHALLRKWLLKDSPLVLWSDNGEHKLVVEFNVVTDTPELQLNGLSNPRNCKVEWFTDRVQLEHESIIYEFIYSHELLDRQAVLNRHYM